MTQFYLCHNYQLKSKVVDKYTSTHTGILKPWEILKYLRYDLCIVWGTCDERVYTSSVLSYLYTEFMKGLNSYDHIKD